MKHTLGDITVAFNELGRGEPIVMLHGLAEDGSSFSSIQRQLEDFHTFAPDLRGHGGTDLGQADGTLEQLGMDLVRFIGNVTGPAACLGYSLGGTIVLWAAARHPELVRRAIVAGTSAKVGHAALEYFKERIALAESDFPAFRRALESDTAAQLARDAAGAGPAAQRRLLAVGDGAGYVNAARAMMRLHEKPLTTLLGEIRCRVDVIGGDKDVFCPRKAAEMIVEHAGDAHYHELQDCGHLFNLDQPADYANTLRQILSR